MEYHIYLAGEIHSDWRDQLRASIQAKPGITFHFWGPQENHDLSDAIGEHILGEQPNAIYKDLQASKINNLRTELHLKKADLVIALFGEKFKQWNTATDAATAIALGKPTIIIRPEALHHPLKELSEKANVTVDTIEQAAQVIDYIFA
ncbi:YtoQ family protein [Listeria booriae]|uniref:YtoQ family protein n=1 Tax=Listeria booriae TaxID=1552123 RepID=UPI0016271EA6|nr:YtoQ family protein [Listeria booriae]MBC1357878.1 YtoQ family protein [Listeria booriae]MBC2317482.1 YtoQ family protein [Listeria booriae]